MGVCACAWNCYNAQPPSPLSQSDDLASLRRKEKGESIWTHAHKHKHTHTNKEHIVEFTGSWNLWADNVRGFAVSITGAKGSDRQHEKKKNMKEQIFQRTRSRACNRVPTFRRLSEFTCYFFQANLCVLLIFLSFFFYFILIVYLV